MLFSIKNLKYKDILNIEKLNLPEKKIICIVGESGGGKTTLLKMLNKLVSPDSGNIYYKNKDLSEIDAVTLRREVVMLSQSPSIFKGTVKENLLIGIKFAEKPQVSDEALKDVLDFVNLNKDLKDNADLLSGGEKQRLALARVILMEPQVYLLDEPSSALDEETEELIIRKMVNHCRKRNKSLIMVTHSKTMAETYYDYLIELKSGNILNVKEAE